MNILGALVFASVYFVRCTFGEKTDGDPKSKAVILGISAVCFDPKDVCNFQPCQNEGRCSVPADDDQPYKCHCFLGFGGASCENKLVSIEVVNAKQKEAKLSITRTDGAHWAGYITELVNLRTSRPLESRWVALPGRVTEITLTNLQPGTPYSVRVRPVKDFREPQIWIDGPTFETPVARDCSDYYKAGVTETGVYLIDPDGKGAFSVYCDMTTDGGGWTVFQRRQDGSQDFYLGWSEYKAGFGQLTGEFWLGLDKIHRLTASRPSKLRVEVGDWSGGRAYAKYGSFGVDDEQALYRLSVGSYSGTAGDSLAYHNNMKFSTKDRENDKHSSRNCAVDYTGAWWYNGCHKSNLNGRYLGNTFDTKGVNWYHYKNNRISMKFAEMKLRPTN